MPDQDDKCWQCGRKIKGGRVLVQIVGEDQRVYVGPDCAKQIAKRGTIETTRGHFIKAEVCDCQNPEPKSGASLVSNDAEHTQLALAAAIRLRRYLQLQFDPRDEDSIAAADALYRAAIFAIREHAALELARVA